MNIFDKQKTSKVMGYTLFVIVTICSIIYPETNSKYYTNSSYTRSNLQYNTGIFQLYEEPKVKIKVDHYNTDTNKVTVSFTFDRHKVGSDIARDTFTVVPTVSGCTVTEVNGVKGNTVTFTNSMVNRGIKVNMSCDGILTGTEEVQAFGVKITLDDMAETTASARIYEEITPVGATKEDRFIYQDFEKQTISTNIAVPYRNSIDIDLSKSDWEIYSTYVGWLVKYIYTNLNENKDVIIDYLSNYLNYVKEDPSVMAKSVENIKNGNILGISRKLKSGNTYTFTISPNILGYAQTYEDYNTSTDKNILNMHFTSINIGQPSINQIFEEYLDEYFPEEYRDSLDKVKEYVRNTKNGNYESAYSVLLGNPIPGLYATELGKVLSMNIEEIITRASAANTFTINTLASNPASEFRNGFITSPLIKSAGLDADTNYFNSVLGGIGTTKEMYYYLSNGNPANTNRVDFNDDTYFISYLSGSGASTKYLLTKLSPNRTDDTIEVTLSDLETTLNEPNIKETLKGKDIFINIKTSSASGTSGDAVKTSNLITLLRAKIDADAFPYEGEVNDHISQAPTLKAYYYHFSYKITDTIQEALNEVQPDEVVTTKPKDTDEVAEISEIEAEATPIGGNPPENINDELPLVVLNKAEVLEDFRKAAVETNNEDILDYKVIPAVKLATPESDTDTAEADLEIGDIQRTKLETRPKDADETEEVITKASSNEEQGDNREITDIIVDDNTEESANE